MANNGKPELTTRQKKAIAALISQPDAKAAAKRARVGYRTIMRWLAEDDQFKRALVEAESDAINEAGRLLLAGQKQAFKTLFDLMTNARSESTRRLSAVAWIDFGLRYRELRNIEGRIADLEAEVYGKANR